MAEKSDIPRASASLRSITPMVRITGGPVVDSAPMRAWTYIMLVPPGKEEHRAASVAATRAHINAAKPGLLGGLPNWRDYSRFSGLVARLTLRVDGYQQLEQPEGG